jgi:hypothetical protein
MLFSLALYLLGERILKLIVKCATGQSDEESAITVEKFIQYPLIL